MLGYVQIVTLYVFNFFLFSIKYQGKARPAQTKLMPAKLRAVLACAESDFVQC